MYRGLVVEPFDRNNARLWTACRDICEEQYTQRSQAFNPSNSQVHFCIARQLSRTGYLALLCPLTDTMAPFAARSSPPVASLSQEEVDKMLLTSNKVARSRNKKACYPCSRRKVRCDKEVVQPCSNCMTRGQGGICAYTPSNDRRTHPHSSQKRLALRGNRSNAREDTSRSSRQASSSDEQSSVSPSTIVNGEWGTVSSRQPKTGQSDKPGATGASTYPSGSLGQDLSPESPSDAFSNVGDCAMATFVSHQAESTRFAGVGIVQSMLGLQNRAASYPFSKLRSFDERWRELEAILPSSEDVLTSVRNRWTCCSLWDDLTCA